MAKKIIGGISSVFPMGAIGIAKSIFGKKKAAPAPVADAPTVMPLPDDAAIKAAKKRSIIRQMGRSGRDSTILTGDKLGG